MDCDGFRKSPPCFLPRMRTIVALSVKLYRFELASSCALSSQVHSLSVYMDLNLQRIDRGMNEQINLCYSFFPHPLALTSAHISVCLRLTEAGFSHAVFAGTEWHIGRFGTLLGWLYGWSEIICIGPFPKCYHSTQLSRSNKVFCHEILCGLKVKWDWTINNIWYQMTSESTFCCVFVCRSGSCATF